MDNFFILESVGYPRSGNHFLNYALRLMYYPDFQTKIVSHDYNKLTTEFVFVPFRNPADSIPSFDISKLTSDPSVECICLCILSSI